MKSPATLVKIMPVAPCKLDVEFYDGTKGRVDISDIANVGIYTQLQDKDFFAHARVVRGGTAIKRNAEIDADALSLYLKLRKIDFSSYRKELHVS